MKSLIFFLALALVIVHALGLRQCAYLNTESQIHAHSEARLNNDELAQVEVEAKYRDAVLRGKVDTHDAKRRAEDLVREVIPTGRTRVRNEIEVVHDRASAFIASMAGGVIDISGVVPSASLRKQLVDAVESLAKGSRVHSMELKVDGKAESQPWLGGMADFAKEFLAKTGGGRIEAGRSGLRLQGAFESQADKDVVMNRALKMLPASRIFDETRVSGPQDATLLVSRKNGAWQISAALPANSAGRGLVSNLLEWDRDAKVSLAPEVRDAAWVDGAWEALNGYFGDVPGNASVKIDADGLDLDGEVLSAGKQKQARSWFQKPAWKGLAILDNGLVVREVRPFKLEFVAKGGQVTTNGTVGSPAQVAQVRSAVQDSGARMAGKVDPVSGVQAPVWWPKFPALFARFYAEADDAKLAIHNNQITLSGKMKKPGGGAEFKRQLAAVGGLPTVRMDELEWPALRTPTLALRRGPDGEIQLTGTVANAADRAAIIKAVDATEPRSRGKIQNGIEVRQGYASPAWIKNFATWWPQLKTNMPDAAFDYQNNEFRLQGEAKSPAANTQVAGLVSSTFGRSVKFMPRVTLPMMKEPTLVLQRNPNGIVLSGEVATVQQRDQILAAVRASERGVNVRGEGLKVNPSVKNADWVGNFATWWGQLRSRVPNATFQTNGADFALEGSPASPAADRQLAGWFQGAFGDGFKLNRSNVKLPKQRAPSLALKREGKAVAITGEVESKQVGDKIVAAIRAQEPQGTEIRPNFKIDPYVTTPGWLANFGDWWPNFRRKVPDATFAFDNGTLNIDGKAAASGQDKEAEKVLIAAFGNDLKTRNFSIKPNQDKTPWLSIVAKDDGIQVSGMLANAREKKIVTDALARLGKVNSSGLKVDAASKTAPWVQNVSNYSRDLIQARKRGTVVLQNGTALVEAYVADKGEQNRLELAFEKAVGAGFKVDKRLRVVVPEPAQIVLGRRGADTVLTGRVGTDADWKMIDDAVKKTDPSVKNQIEVAPGATRPKWLAQFPQWWPKFRVAVPEGGFSAKGDEDPKFTDGKLAGKTSDKEAANLLADIWGKRLDIDFSKFKMPTLSRPRLSLQRNRDEVVLTGMVPTAQHRTNIETAVKKTDAKVTNRISVDENVETPDWLVKFGEWWPKLRKDVPDATFTLDEDNNSRIGGQADEAAQKRVGGLLSGIFGSQMKLPKFEMRKPAPNKAPWLRFQGDSGKIVVIGEVADANAKRQLDATLAKFKGQVSTAGVNVVAGVKPENWTANAGNYMVQLMAAAAGPANLDLKDGAAEVNATLKSEQDRSHFSSSLGRIVGTNFRLNNGLKVGRTTPPDSPDSPDKPGNKPEKPAFVLEDLMQGVSVYFPKNSSYYSNAEKQKIQQIAKEIAARRDNNLTVYLVGHADARGRSDYNQWLSKKRADRVSRLLTSYGVRNSIVRVDAKGETGAASAKAGESAWKRDRRVDIRVGRAR